MKDLAEEKTRKVTNQVTMKHPKEKRTSKEEDTILWNTKRKALSK